MRIVDPRALFFFDTDFVRRARQVHIGSGAPFRGSRELCVYLNEALLKTFVTFTLPSSSGASWKRPFGLGSTSC